MKIFVAGPYTLGDIAINVRNSCIVAEKLVELGHLPFLPHLYHLWHLVSPHEYSYWTELDNAWLEQCDAILRLPGHSFGADNEIILANKLRFKIYWSIDEIERVQKE